MAKKTKVRKQKGKGPPNPTDFSQFSSWLARQPRRWSVVIAARAAFRAVPLAQGERNLAAIALPVFRATAIARFAAMYPKRAKAVRPVAAAAAHAFGDFDVRQQFSIEKNERLPTSVVRYAALQAASSIGVEPSTGSHAAAAAVDAFIIGPANVSGRDEAYAAVAVDARRLDHAEIEPVQLARAPLWPTSVPPAVAIDWYRLAADLSVLGHHWQVWIDWYSDSIGSAPVHDWTEPELAAFTDVQGKYPWNDKLPWEDGAEAVNTAIARRLERLRPPSSVPSTATPLPPQGPGPHFGLSEIDLIDRSPPSDVDSVGNDLGRIRQLLPLVQQYAEVLSRQLAGNKYPELEKAVRDYHAAIAVTDKSDIAWGEVFGLGVFLQNAADAARREIKDRMLPELEDTALTTLESLLRLHGPLILASNEGRELSAQADAFQMTREEIATLAKASQIVAASVKASDGIATKTTAAEVEQAAAAIDKGRHPERGTIYGLATIRNMSLVLIAAATVSPPLLLGLLAGIPGTIAGTAVTFLGLESLKKSATFVAIAAQLGAKIDSMTGPALEAWINRRIQASAPFQDFALKNEEALRQIAATTQQLKWLADYIDLIKAARDAGDKPQS
jgi:hypothetical protein